MNAHCLYTEYQQGFHPGNGRAGVVDRKGATRTNSSAGAPANRGMH